MIDRSIEIHSSQDRVWGLLQDIQRWPRWGIHMWGVVPLSQEPLRSGGRVRMTLWGGLPYEVETIEHIPNRSWKWVGPLLWTRLIYDHTVESLGPTASRIRLHFALEGAFSRLLAAAIRPFYQPLVDRFLQRLKAEAESPLAA